MFSWADRSFIEKRVIGAIEEMGYEWVGDNRSFIITNKAGHQLKITFEEIEVKVKEQAHGKM